MMRRSILVTLAAVALAGGALLAARWTARPVVALDPPVADFGTLSAQATRTILVRNHGRAALRILGASSSCGCTTAALDRVMVPPGGAARLVVTFDPIAHGPDAGPARHVVYLRTNDPRTPEAELEVRAVVTGRP